MININLLPWREEQRKEKKKNFLLTFSISLAITLLFIIFIHILLSKSLNRQNHRNSFLLSESQNVNSKISKLDSSQKNYAASLLKLRKLEQIYNNRFLLVNLLNNLYQIMPHNLQLTHLKYKCRNVELTGIASSNDAISKFVENISGSKFLVEPMLNKVNLVERKKIKVKEFNIHALLKNAGC